MSTTAENILSQDEVDALLADVAGDMPSQAEMEAVTIDPNQPRTYKIGLQERIVRQRMPTLELINERYVRNLRSGLFNFLRRSVEVSMKSLRFVKYSDFTRNIVVPSNINMFGLKPLRGMGLLVVDPSLVFLMIDNMFGGDGRFHMYVEGREFSTTEQRMIKRFLDIFFSEYEKAWEAIYKVSFEYIRSELNFQFASVATNNDVILEVTLSVEFSGNSGQVYFCIPYLMLEPIRDILYSTYTGDASESDPRWKQTLRKQIVAASVEISAPFVRANVTLGDIVKMKKGDIIPVELTSTIVAEIDNVPLLKARYGVSNRHYALLVDEMIMSAEDMMPTFEPKSEKNEESHVRTG